jgi:hypothetical protein
MVFLTEAGTSLLIRHNSIAKKMLNSMSRNTNGTINYNPRVHTFKIDFTPQPKATIANPSPPNLIFTYLDTILFSGPDGKPATGLDASATETANYPGFPNLPIAVYVGDGFGGDGPGGRRIPIDSEGLVLRPDGSFWVSDEYGPYIYHFNSKGRMIAAIKPPEAIIPHRNGSESFNADSPPRYDPDFTVTPADPTTGRADNQGFEGLTITPDGKTLYALLQSATDQEGGLAGKQTNRYSRLVEYDITSPKSPRYAAEYIVELPQWTDPTASKKKNPKTAAQSEIHYIGDSQFLVLARDSGSGHGQDSSLSIYRHVDVFDISNATNIKGSTYDAATGAAISAAGVPNADVTPAPVCGWLDFNVNSQLGRFGLHNGGAQDSGLLNEKWESLGVVPVDGKNGADGEYYIFSFSDNDFITQNGYFNSGKDTYQDGSGYSLDNQALVFKVKLPKLKSGHGFSWGWGWW